MSAFQKVAPPPCTLMHFFVSLYVCHLCPKNNTPNHVCCRAWSSADTFLVTVLNSAAPVMVFMRSHVCTAVSGKDPRL